MCTDGERMEKKLAVSFYARRDSIPPQNPAEKPGVTPQRGTDSGTRSDAGTVEALAAALLGLSPEDRARLATVLLGQQADGAMVNPATPDAPAGR